MFNNAVTEDIEGPPTCVKTVLSPLAGNDATAGAARPKIPAITRKTKAAPMSRVNPIFRPLRSDNPDASTISTTSL
jgi:hypothetical protein